MIKEFVKKMEAIIPNQFPVDPTRFHDPVAMQTEWRGILQGRVSRASNRLVQTGPDQLAYKPSISGGIAGVAFALVGAFMVFFYFAIGSGSVRATYRPGSGSPVVLVAVGLVFMAVGVILVLQATSPVVFDRRDAAFYKGRKQRRQLDAADSKHAVRFTDIHAIQLLARLESRSTSSGSSDHTPDIRRTQYYRVYDLNLVKHDGQRMYVTTYNKPEQAKADAAKIGALVNVPIWDAIDY